MATENQTLSPIFDPTAARAIAMSAGDWNEAVRRHIAELLRNNKNSFVQATLKGLQELAERQVISAEESKRLGEIFRLVVDVERNRADAEEAFLKIRDAYYQMIAMKHSSPAALAIAGVARASFALEKNSPLHVNPVAGGAGAIAGAAAGAGIGFGIGGPLGAAIGGVIGGAVGATVGLCGSGQT
jgi:hypothetical protein